MGKKPNLGYVNWPNRTADTDDSFGGMWVYAFWRAEYTESVDAGVDLFKANVAAVHKDPFIHAEGAEHVIALPVPWRAMFSHSIYPTDRVVPSVPVTMENIQRGDFIRYTLDAGVPVLAAVCLGTSSVTYTGWFCQRGSLTKPGRKLLDVLNTLYGRQAELITYVAPA